MAANPVRLMTVEELRRIPEERGATVYELHQGEVVEVTRPKMKHYRIQRQLRRLLEALVGETMIVEIEMPFRALPEHELRAADIGIVSVARWDQIDPDDNLMGAPDIVIEVLSPSNSVSEMFEREQLCLANGCLAFWTVDPDRQCVRVATPEFAARTYRRGDQIPLGTLGSLEGRKLSVSALFG